MLILTFIVIVALAAFAGYFAGTRRQASPPPEVPAVTPIATLAPVATPPAPDPAVDTELVRVDSEKARLVRGLSRETFALRDGLDIEDAAAADLVRARASLTELDAAITAEREETARYRQLVVDIENNAPPPILLGTNEPDDLKLIVGIGPVLERMLHNLGIGTFRQIARWSERDVAEFDAKLPEFSGRIVRDQWVTQARALHESKYGASPLRRST